MDVHTWFGLSYSSYLVLDPLVIDRLTDQQRTELGLLIERMMRTFAGHRQAFEQVAIIGQCHEFGELTPEQMHHWQVTYDDSEETGFPDAPYDYRGECYGPEHRHVFPAETLPQARAAGRLVLHRTMLQSMDQRWQEDFIALIDAAPENQLTYDVRSFDEQGREIDDPLPGYNRGRTVLAASPAVQPL